MNYNQIGAAVGCAKAGGWKFEPLRLTNTGTDNATVAFEDISQTGTVLKVRHTPSGEFDIWNFSSITLQPGEFIEIAGDNHEAGGFLGKFQMTGESVAASGSIMSIAYGENMTEEDEKVIPFIDIFHDEGEDEALFRGCVSLTTAPKLPATQLVNGSYKSMFSNCTSLTAAPELPATQLASECYNSMFSGCTSLTVAPELPATTLADGCYKGMFYGCTSLTVAPELPATTLARSCYCLMFHGCVNLTTAPELPATILAAGCYSEMFYGCEHLQSVTVRFSSWEEPEEEKSCTTDWLEEAATTGTFTCPSDLDTTRRNTSAIPENWTVQTV